MKALQMKTTTQATWPGIRLALAALSLSSALSSAMAATSVQFSTDTFLADENRTPARVSIQRSGDATGALTITVLTANNTAIAGEDYVAASVPMSFAPGETNTEFEITLLDDYFAEPDKTVVLQITNLPAGVTSTRPQATLLIRDDDRPGSIDWTWSSTFGLLPQQVSNAFVRVVSWLPDGKTILDVHVSSSVPFCRVVRIDRDGSVDPTFQISENHVASQFVRATPDGKLLVITDGATSGDQVRSLALQGRLNSDGTRDTNFSANVSGRAFTVLPLLDGNLLVWTLDTLFPVFLNGQTMPRLFRLNNDGTLDSSFVLNAPAWRFPEVIAPQTNGQILISVLESAFPRTSKLFRLNQDGSFDSGFQVGRGEQIGTVLTQADGRFVVSGHFATYNGQTVNSIVRLHQDGSIDDSFQSGIGFLTSGNGRVWVELRALAGGQTVAFGEFDSYNGQQVARAVLLNSNGTSDTALSNQGTFVFIPGIDERLEIPALFVHGQFVGIGFSDAFFFDDGPFLFIGYGMSRLRTELSLRIVSTSRGGDGTIRFTANALSGRSYTLQASQNLTNWDDLTTQPATTNRLHFLDTSSSSPAMRFYRVKGN
jgi:uncharacterized delta-60 repeat protein